MKIKNLLLASLITLSTASAFVVAPMNTEVAGAHRRRSKIYGPFGSWTWGPDIPHYHTPSSSDSCLGGGSPPCGHPDPTYKKPSYNSKYRVKSIMVSNKSKSRTLRYRFKGQSYRLAPRKSRRHDVKISRRSGNGIKSERFYVRLSSGKTDYCSMYEMGRYKYLDMLARSSYVKCDKNNNVTF